MTTTEMRLAQLKCEHRVNPLGIDVVSPRLSWVLESSQRSQSQSAYQILVAGRQEDLEAEKHLLWDSGKVISNRSINIEYEGAALRSGMRCYWKVRVWDREDRPGAYSKPAVWSMGLLNPSDWLAEWISPRRGTPGGFEPPSQEWTDHPMARASRPPYLRKAFTLSGPVREATLYVTARGLYEIWLNGARVGDAVLAPGWTDYNKRILYQTYDVTTMLTPGENALGSILGDGWYAGYVGFDPKRRGAHYGSHLQLLLQLQVQYEDGTVATIVSDGSWVSAIGPLRYADFLMGECYDARYELDGWSEPGFDDSQWRNVDAESPSDVQLVADPSQPIRVMQEIAAKTVTNPSPGTYVFDLGQNMVGWVRLRVRGEAGTRVTLRHAEVLNPDGTIYTRNLRSVQATDAYILKGADWEVFQPRFTFHGFRYVEVTGYPGEPALEAITGCVVHSDTPFSGTFECSSPLINQLQSNIVWGQRGNFVSIPTDCPQRDERLGWMGDAQIFVRTACFNADVAAFFTKWLTDVADAQSLQGAFPDIAPLLYRSFGFLGEGAPAWGDAGVIVPWTIYRVYGDTRIIAQQYTAMTRWMDYIHSANPNLLRQQRLNNNYGDWLSPSGDHTPKDLLATAYWAYDAKLMAEMTDALGHQDDARKYKNLFQGIKEAFMKAYVAPDGRINGDTQTCYVLALYMDLLPDELRAAAAKHLVAAIEKKDWHLSTGFVGVGYLCPALTEAGYTDVAYRLLNNDTFPSWGYTIRHGATTIWERWDGWTEERGFQSSEMNSFNHYSLGSVGDWLYRYVAGIDLDYGATGYERFVIHPRPGGGLTWARGEYASIRGKILSEWKVEDHKILLKVIVPPNTTATVYVPATRKSELVESGKPVEQAEGIKFLRMGEGEVVLAVESGEYEFVGSIE